MASSPLCAVCGKRVRTSEKRVAASQKNREWLGVLLEPNAALVHLLCYDKRRSHRGKRTQIEVGPAWRWMAMGSKNISVELIFRGSYHLNSGLAFAGFCLLQDEEVKFPGVIAEELVLAAAAAAAEPPPAPPAVPNFDVASAPSSVQIQSQRVAPLRPSSDLSKRGIGHRVVKLDEISGGDPPPVIAAYLNTRPDAIEAVNRLLTTNSKVVKPSLPPPPPAPLPPPPPPVAQCASCFPFLNDTVAIAKLDAFEALALKLQLGLSNEKYTGLCDWLRNGNSDSVLPPLHYLHTAMRMSAPETKVVNVNGLSMSISSLTDVITKELRENAELRKKTLHRVKIGGDASFDPREKEAKSASILLLIFAWMDSDAGLFANSTMSHRTVAAAWAKESYETVQTMCGHFAAEITKLRDEGLEFTFEGTTTVHKFDFYVMGDAKWMRIAYGLGGCASTYGCLYCPCPRWEIPDAIYEGKLGKGYDKPLDQMRTIKRMRELAAAAALKREEKAERAANKAEKRKEKKNVETKEEKKTKKTKKGRGKKKKVEDADDDDEKEEKTSSSSVGAEVENQEYPPAWDIEPRNAPPERLHTLLCISRIFERHLAAILHPKATCKRSGKSQSQKPVNDLRNNKEHDYHCLKPLGIDKRPITGYTGEEWKKILAEPERWLCLISNHREHPLMLKSMKEWGRLYAAMTNVNDEKTAEAWGQEVLAWAQDLVVWCDEAQYNFYLHVLATHAWRWFSLHEYATFAMEKVNANFKQSKRRTSFDRKTLEATRSAKGSMETMMKMNNAKNLLLGRSPIEKAKRKREARSTNKSAMWKCGRCEQRGHKSNSPKCPKRPSKVKLSERMLATDDVFDDDRASTDCTNKSNCNTPHI